MDGVVYVGGKPRPENLLRAYRLGIFPWPMADLPLLWHCPEERGVLFFSEIKISRALRKQAKKAAFNFTLNAAFAEVIQACANAPRSGPQGTWITKEMQQGYTELHRQGWAHSVECWQAGKLVGGLYGVCVDGVFSGESMFYRESGASKLALLWLCRELERLGFTWMDIQMVTPVTEALGGRYLQRAEYLIMLKQRQRNFGENQTLIQPSSAEILL